MYLSLPLFVIRQKDVTIEKKIKGGEVHNRKNPITNYAINIDLKKIAPPEALHTHHKENQMH